MQRILVWDLPIRLFHWLFAGGFIAAFTIANTVDDDSPGFTTHMILGLILAFMVAMRVIWGLVGTRWARFRTFLFGPGALLRYLRAAFTGGDDRHAGHNPGAAAAIWAIFALVIGLAVTGVMMGQGSEAAEDIHETLAWLLFAAVALHLVGIAFHTLRHRENIAASMVHGRKLGDPEDAIRSSRPVFGLVFLALTGAWAWGLVDSYDAAARQVTLPLTGPTLTLGENEGAEGGGEYEHRGHDDDDDD